MSQATSVANFGLTPIYWSISFLHQPCHRYVNSMSQSKASKNMGLGLRVPTYGLWVKQLGGSLGFGTTRLFVSPYLSCALLYKVLSPPTFFWTATSVFAGLLVASGF